jgi:hypothetical protein
VKEIFASQPNRPKPIVNPPPPEPLKVVPAGSGVDRAVASFFEAGVKLLESMTADSLAGLFKRDPVTQQPTLSIPLPESLTPERLTNAITSFFQKGDRRN